MAKKSKVGLTAEERRAMRKKPTDIHRPANKHKRLQYKKYRGQGR